MSKAQVSGITGLLDGILSPAAKPDSRFPHNTHPTSGSAGKSPPARAMPARPAVRRGRPPGKAAESRPKEKMTVWLERSLIDSYRDWTWQARCQLSHIVERALVAYHEQHRGGCPGR